MKLKSSVLALVLAVAGCMTSAFAQDYTFDNVQYSSGGVTDTFTQFLAINNQGVVAGYHGASVNKGFTYFSNTKKFVNENYPGSMQTQVTGINNLGKTVGFYITPSNQTKGFQFADGTYYNSNFPSTPFNQLLGQNDFSQAAGYYSATESGSAPDHAYVLDESGQVWMSFVLPNSTQAQATSINNAGDVCGFTVDSKSINHGWVTISGSLILLNYPESTGTQAFGLNNKSQVVGAYTDSSNNTHGFVYNLTTHVWQSIDNPDGVGTTIVNGINDNGVLVGFYGTSPINTAFIATPKP